MTTVEKLKEELARERKRAESRYASQQAAARDEEIRGLQRIEFRHILENELTRRLIPYLQDYVIEGKIKCTRKEGEEGKEEGEGEKRIIAFVLDPIVQEEGVVTGRLENSGRSMNLRFSPEYDGHKRQVYRVLEFRSENGNLIADEMLRGMRRTSEGIARYFELADRTGNELQEPVFPREE